MSISAKVWLGVSLLGTLAGVYLDFVESDFPFFTALLGSIATVFGFLLGRLVTQGVEANKALGEAVRREKEARGFWKRGVPADPGPLLARRSAGMVGSFSMNPFSMLILVALLSCSFYYYPTQWVQFADLCGHPSNWDLEGWLWGGGIALFVMALALSRQVSYSVHSQALIYSSPWSKWWAPLDQIESMSTQTRETELEVDYLAGTSTVREVTLRAVGGRAARIPYDAKLWEALQQALPNLRGDAEF